MNPLQEEIRRRIMQATSIGLEACDAVSQQLATIDVDKMEDENLLVVMANGLESTAANLMQCANTLKVANLRLAIDSGSVSFDDALKDLLENGESDE